MRVFIAYSYGEGDDLARGLRSVLSDSGYEVFSPDTVSKPGRAIFASITAAIQTADVVVALLTSPNPNVYFELGMAAGSSIPMVVASQRPENAVVDLASAPYVELTGDTAQDVSTIFRRVSEIAPAVPDRSQTQELTLRQLAQDPASLQKIGPQAFERMVAQAFADAGYVVDATPSRSDSGIDIIIESDPLTVVQVKLYRSRHLVPVGAVRELFGAMTAIGASRAILVSSAGVTRSAKAAAEQWPIDLMTIGELSALQSRGNDRAESP
jgi:HJR/Mrr/RecB family endonuclease